MWYTEAACDPQTGFLCSLITRHSVSGWNTGTLSTHTHTLMSASERKIQKMYINSVWPLNKIFPCNLWINFKVPEATRGSGWISNTRNTKTIHTHVCLLQDRWGPHSVWGPHLALTWSPSVSCVCVLKQWICFFLAFLEDVCTLRLWLNSFLHIINLSTLRPKAELHPDAQKSGSQKHQKWLPSPVIFRFIISVL